MSKFSSNINDIQELKKYNACIHCFNMLIRKNCYSYTFK